MKVSLKALLKAVGRTPFDSDKDCNVWGWEGLVTRETVFGGTSLEKQSYSHGMETARFGEFRDYDHNARIRWLMANTETWQPIDLDVGCPNLGLQIEGWNMVLDGWHRFAAAICLRLEEVEVEFSGEVTRFENLFGVKVNQLEKCDE